MLTDYPLMLFTRLIEPLGCLVLALICLRYLTLRETLVHPRRRSGWRIRSSAVLVGAAGLLGRVMSSVSILITETLADPTELQILAETCGIVAIEVSFAAIVISMWGGTISAPRQPG